jgi:hypothetical protein
MALRGFRSEFNATFDGQPSALSPRVQQPYDAAAKALIDAALSRVCEVAIQAPATADTMYVDAVVSPRAPREALLERGMLGRLALDDCAFEVFAETPDRYDVDLCVARVLWIQAKARRARRLWIISPGLARQAIAAWGLERLPEWGCAVYGGVTFASPSIVVLSELAPTRDTLLLRLMGSGALLREAIADARALPADAWERPIIDELLLQMERDLDRMMGTKSKASEELQMRYAELVKINEAERAEWRAEARAAGLAEGRAEGHAEGVLVGERAALRTIVAARGWTLSAAQGTRVEECSDPQQITTWIRRAAVVATVDAVFDER